jgi:hypothetical protein
MRLRFAPIVLALIVTAGCAQPEPETATSVESPTLGVRVAVLPEGFTVVQNTSGILHLAPTGEGVTGFVEMRVGPEETGVNLVAAVHAHQARIEGLPEGAYSGARELEGPLGTAFYSRGRFTTDDGAVEETLLTVIHPSGGRRLDLVYTYPAGDDSGDRVTALIGLLAEVEALTPASGEADG